MTFKTMYLRLEEISTAIKNDSIIDIEELIRLQEEAKVLYALLTQKLGESHVL